MSSFRSLASRLPCAGQWPPDCRPEATPTALHLRTHLCGLGAHTPAALERSSESLFDTFVQHRTPGVFHGLNFFKLLSFHGSECVCIAASILQFGRNGRFTFPRTSSRAGMGTLLSKPSPRRPAGTSVEPRRVGRREEAVWCGNGWDAHSAFPEDSHLASGSFIQDAADPAATSQPCGLTGEILHIYFTYF